MRRMIVLLLVALVGTLLSAGPATAGVSLSKYEEKLVAAVNRERTKRGLKRLRVNARLTRAARTHSAEMGRKKYFRHNSHNGESWSARIVRHGYTRKKCRLWRAGENIYWGSGLYSSPDVVVKTWMGSKPHRAVILTKVFRDIGVGARKTATGFGEVEGAVWFFTLDLGRRIRG